MAVGGLSMCPRVTSASVQTDGKLMAKGSSASAEERGTGVGGDHGEGESRDSDCLCLSCLNGKTFTNGCGYRFCQRFVTSWYSHKNKYLHKFQVWEDAVDKPSRLVKCRGKR